MRVYISGKIGEEVISDATRRKFGRAEEMLRAKGHEAFNPTSEKWQRTLRRTYEKDLKGESAWIEGTFPGFYTCCLLRDLMMLSTKDAIYLLEDWQQSPGAKAEYQFAVAAGKRMYFADRHDACEYLIERMYREAEESGKPIEYDGLQDRNDIEIAYFKKHLHEAWWPPEGKEAGK